MKSDTPSLKIYLQRFYTKGNFELCDFEWIYKSASPTTDSIETNFDELI